MHLRTPSMSSRKSWLSIIALSFFLLFTADIGRADSFSGVLTKTVQERPSGARIVRYKAQSSKSAKRLLFKGKVPDALASGVKVKVWGRQALNKKSFSVATDAQGNSKVDILQDSAPPVHYSNDEIKVGDTVECPCCAGNNVDLIDRIDQKGLATLRNQNNGGTGKISILNLRKLESPEPINDTCLDGICVGQNVYVSGATGSGDKEVKVLQFFSNGTANVQGIFSNEISTYRRARLSSQANAPFDIDCSPNKKLSLNSTCVGPTQNYTNCSQYCAYIGMQCAEMCSSPAGRLNQAASAWPRQTGCSATEVDIGGDVSCDFNFNDDLGANPRWRCCCV